MGLDMYLRKRVYIGANYDHNKVSGKITIKKDSKPVKINFKKVTEIIESAGYWRKANAIHKWFVDNVQDGVDDCREAYVSKENLIDLLNTCKKAMLTQPTKGKGKTKKVKVKAEIEETAEDLLPTAEGFFFGGTEFDEGYYQDINDTIEIIEDLLKEGIDNADIYYQSSW
jgi:hypothetical protein